jgi:hypothetical protein
LDVTVVSPGLRAGTKARCLESVARQRGVRFEHVYIEAGDQSPPLTALQNQYDAIVRLPSTRIVVLLDGDDWLACDDALLRVAREHERGAWLTYGSFVDADGQPGFAAPVQGAPRQVPWTSTHLKSLRAGLVQAVRQQDLMGPEGSLLRGEGGWLRAAADQALMLPALEMATAARARFVPDILCVYDNSGSLHVDSTQGGRAVQEASATYIRSLAPYAPLDSLPPMSVEAG